MSEIAYKLIDNFNTASRDVQKVISTSNLELFMDAWNSLSGYIEELESHIAELEADNAEFRQLIRDWSIVLEQNDEFQLWQVESVRQAMLEINKEREG